MQTREIARHLAAAARSFPWLGQITEENLLALVRAELGDETILERFVPYADHGKRRHVTRAVGAEHILHIISGNTPHAGLQTVIRGLLVGSHNWCKIPSDGLPELSYFRDLLPFELARRIEISTELRGDWLERADTLVVFGGDDTVEHFRQQTHANQRFVAHPHRFSLGVIFDDPECRSAEAAARDISLFDQQGCLSPHVLYVPAPFARTYGEQLARALDAFEKQTPRAPLSLAEENAIIALRSEYTFRAANHPEIALWTSENSTAWTVLLDNDPHFTPSCLNRVITLKPLPETPAGLAAATVRIRKQISTVGIYPDTLENAERIATIGATRICPIGDMQYPALTWHHDGRSVLTPLVRFIDFESKA
jgi:hypothetical protein